MGLRQLVGWLSSQRTSHVARPCHLERAGGLQNDAISFLVFFCHHNSRRPGIQAFLSAFLVTSLISREWQCHGQVCVCQWGRRWPDILHSIVSLCWVLYVEAFRSIQMSIDADFLSSSSVVWFFADVRVCLCVNSSSSSHLVAVEHWVISAAAG